MKLNFEILQIELSYKFSDQVSGVNRDCGLMESVALYEPGMALSPECCYVCESFPPGEILQGEKALFLLCGEGSEEITKGSKNSFLYFSSAQSAPHVMNAVVAIFAKYSRWENNLLESLHLSGSLHDLLELSLPIFENPLFLIDSRFNVIAFGSPDLVPDSLHLKDKVPEIWILRGKDDLIRARKEDEKPYFRHLSNDYPRLFINMYEGEYLLGNLSIQASHRELQARDGYLLTQLARIVRTAMLRSVTDDNNKRSLLEKMLAEIITGGVVDSEEFFRLSSAFGVAAGEQVQCLAIRIPRTTEKEYIRYFLQQLGTQIPATYVTTIDDVAAMILSVTRAWKQKIDVISALENKLNIFGFRVGLSDRYENLLYTHQYFLEARYALENGEATHHGNHVALFSDYCMKYILEHCHGDLRPDMLQKEGFKRLLNHDLTGRVCYLETLKAYLDHHLNAQKTAMALQISRNSLLSQLERINALIEEDLNDPQVRFRYELSLLLHNKELHNY